MAGAMLLAAALFTGAQTNVTPSRITRAIDPANLTILRGNTHPLAQARYDRGAAPASLPMRRMLLVLKRGAPQESALDTLLEEQQDTSSVNYHHWLTPQQFGQQFGPSDQDIQTIAAWLQSQGFQIDRVSNGRTVIEFSGTAGEVQSAFHTAIHQYLVNGENHWANSSDPSIPAALAPVVAGIDTLYNFPRHALYETLGPFSRNRATGKIEPAQPTFTLGGQCGVPPGCYGVGPYDFATIYNLLPLWNLSPTPTDGKGVTIAIVGESDINVQDIKDFRSYFGLPANDPAITVNGVDPGTVSRDETESVLDVEWSGAVARGAAIDFVTSASTEASLGVDLSAQYIVDNNLAPILSESYGICELFLGNTGNQFYNQLWQQAAAQGITVLVATGDSGSAVCDRNAQTQGAAQYGLSVSGFSSTPYNVAVGGTDFNDLTNASTYWGSNSTPPGQPTLPATVSAKSYIPETTWNNSCTNAVFGNLLGYSSNAETNCNNPNLHGFVIAAGGSGGSSNCVSGDGQNPLNCTAGYPKPAWQTALTPHDSARDLPDVSLFAAIGGPSGALYLICEADRIPPGITSCDPSDPNTHFIGIGGTSASTPAFAGIMALVNQATGSRQGNANFDLYAMAAKSGASCNSSNGPGANCQFYDVTNGTIEMPCVKGSPNCNVSNQADAVGILSGYNTSSGYDLATGLGSVNAANLVNAWKSFALTLKPSSTALTLTAPSGGSLGNLTHGQTVTFNTSVIAVAPATGTPSGTVALLADTGTNGQEGVQSVTLDGSGNGIGTTNSLPGGTYTVVAQYPGDGTFKSSVSPGTTVTVNPEASKVGIAYELVNPNTGAVTNPNATTAVFGTPSFLRVSVTSAARDACANNSPGSTGCPTGSVTLSDNGNALGNFELDQFGNAGDQAIDLTGGTHTIGAAYAGDGSFSPPNPNPATQVLTITAAATSAILYPNPLTATIGTNVNLTANISAQGLIYSSYAPTGTVTFTLGSTNLGSATVSGTVDSSHSAGASANINTSSLPHGESKITVQYSGDQDYAASSTYNFVTMLYPTSTSVSTSNSSIQFGAPVTLTAQVSTSQTGAPSITGSVAFWVNYENFQSQLGFAELSNGSAQLSTSNLPGGTRSVLAEYMGDVNYATSSGTAAQMVAPDATTTVVTTSTGSVTQGQSVTFTATVSGSPSGPVQTSGNVQFLANGSNIGTASIVSNQQAQITTNVLPTGSDQITAVYSGDNNYSKSTSPAVTEVVNPALTVTANPTSINVSAPGQSGSTTLTFTAENGFSSNGSAPLIPTCTGLPAESTCSVSPSSIFISTNGSTTATLTVMTTAPSAVIPGARVRPGTGGWKGRKAETVTPLGLVLLLCGAIALGFHGRRRRWGLAFALVAFALVFVNAGCGGGSGGGGGGNNGGGGLTNPGTPPGAQQVSVSFTINGVTQTLPLTVDVQ